MNFFQKLFGSDKPGLPQDLNAGADSDKQNSAESSNLPLAFTTGLRVGRKTDVGRQRDQNEDALYAIDTYIETCDGPESFGLFIVADGMGGYKKGEIASNLATRTSADYILENIYLPYLNKNSNNIPQRPILEVLRSAVTTANDEVLQSVPESGSTLTLAMVMGHDAYLAHVGDSRAYLYHDSELTQITQDHSLVARLVELGQATAEEALTHPQRNVLYRAIGQSGTLEVATYLKSLPANSYLLICSDGLWGMIEDDELTRILKSATSPEDGVNKLVEKANANGGEDNITALLIGIGE